jgi:uroporphyrin-III C-methyltransferase/precorrin-2 dehydrogenase/sirohydrochlorin ferrochelatase
MANLASLPLFHRIAGQRVLVLGDGMAAEPKRRLVTRAGGIVIDDPQRAIDEGVRIAFVAFEDARACEVAAINLRCAGMLVNVVDRPDLCDFTTPSILDRNPLLIAVGTGGTSAGLAKHVRLRLERILPQTLGRLAAALDAARPLLRERLPDGSERRRAIDAALREGGALDPLEPTSHAAVDGWARGTLATATARTHAFALTSADPEDLTLRQARLLGEADAICTQGSMPDGIMARARADAARIVCDAATCPLARASAREQAAGDSDAEHCPKAQAVLADSGLTLILRMDRDQAAQASGVSTLSK